ncbi:MAG TPA: SprB repeat-containing protein, partial [Bacteroidia bacterium]|nr:SprB repeat-containing protein [Bacteroidia bacterium]
MKKIIIGIIAFCITNIGSLSASVITVSNNTVNAGQYTSLQAATNAAKPGDTVYVIGSPTNYGTDTIKTPRLTIIGAGYNVTGTENNYNTTVNYIYLRGAVYGTTIQGLYISYNIQQVVTAVSIDSVDIERCYVSTTLFVCGHDWTIRNNNIDNLNIGNNANILIQNNFLQDVGNTNLATVTIDHNDFVTYNGNVTSYTGASTNALFQNNVFYYCNPENTTSCTFKNNFTVSGTVYNLNTYAGNTGSNNVYTTTPGWTDGSIPASTVSQNAVWNHIWTFTVASHAHDSATDGTDIGVTGGSYPMPNLGGLPHIPEMVYLSISGIAPQSGNLNVNFKAQGKMAHGVANAEYFFDNDPGRGNGTPITIPTNPDSVTVNQAIPVGILTGYHVIGVRVKDSTGHWSLYRAAEFYVQPVVTAKTAPIIAAEYFYDNDPGQGHGTPISFAKTTSVNITQSLPIGSLTAGYHNLFVRVEDSTGVWSLYAGRNFYVSATPFVQKSAPIIAAEYFYDNDPGQGNGTAITFSKNTSVNITQSLPIGSLSSGYHNVFVRVEDSTGVWSIYAGRNFYVSPTPLIQKSAPIISAEYFYDNDPGQGKGTAISITKADSINITQALPLGSLTSGFHNVFVRVKDSTGVWSLYAGRNFYISPTALTQKLAPIVAAEYFFDTDPGQGKGTAIAGITSSDSISMTQNLNASALAIGPHNAFIRVEDSTGHWSIYQGSAFKVEICSDKVTATATKDSCYGSNDGTATAAASGGNKPYTYAWNTTPVQTTITATGLIAGIYSITVTDSIGCPATATVVVGQPTQIKIKTTVNPTTCGLNNGSIAASASGGTGTTYTYSWSTVPVQTSSSISNLSAGV